MQRLAGLLILFTSAALVLPYLAAQEQDEKKVDKKDAEKKDEEKKPEEKKGEEKKPDEKKTDAKSDKKTEKKSKSTKIDPEEEKILKETIRMRARIRMTDASSAGEFVVELPYAYPPKVVAAQMWYRQQLALGNRSAEVWNQYRQRMGSARDVEVKIAEGMKVRTLAPPVEYDDKGNLKRWTPKEIKALVGDSKLPGFPAAFDSLRGGQIVELYVAKAPIPKKTPREKEKKKIEEEDTETYYKPEALMIVVILDAPMRP